MAAKDKPIPTPSDSTTISIAELLNNPSITSSKLSSSKNYLPWSTAIKTFLTYMEKLKCMLMKTNQRLPVQLGKRKVLRWGLGCGTARNLMWVVTWYCCPLHMQFGLQLRWHMVLSVTFKESRSNVKTYSSQSKVLDLCMSTIVFWRKSGRNWIYINPILKIHHLEASKGRNEGNFLPGCIGPSIWINQKSTANQCWTTYPQCHLFEIFMDFSRLKSIRRPGGECCNLCYCPSCFKFYKGQGKRSWSIWKEGWDDWYRDFCKKQDHTEDKCW